MRVYSQLVGCNCNEPKRADDSKKEPCLLWDSESQEYLVVEADPDKVWNNPFTANDEVGLPHLITEPDRERSLSVSFSRTVNKVYELARSNVWDWFFTLTFNPARVDSFDYSACVKKLSEWLNNMRKTCPDMRYLVVPELHKSGRYHFHGLFAGCENIEFVESGKYTKSGDIIYNVGSYHLGWSTATRIKSNEKVTKYICKYITKDLCSVAFGRKRYWASRNCKTCDTDTFIISGVDMPNVLSQLFASSKYAKQLDSPLLTTQYFEVGLDFDESILCSTDSQKVSFR